MTTIRIDTRSQSLNWGVGLFETMLVIRGRAAFERQHFDRMIAAARELGLPAPSWEEWRSVVDQATIPATEEYAIRCSYIDSGPTGDGRSWMIIATPFEVPAVTLSRRARGRVIVLPPSIARTMPKYKSLSHLACMIGLRAAIDADADEALFSTSAGTLLEGTSTNVFAIDGTTLVTPPVEAGVLPGIIRAWVIDSAPRVGLAVEIRELELEDLHRGAFLTSSLTRLSPVRSIDGVPVDDPGGRFLDLAKLLDEELERVESR